jgi:septal ring factor EnvC (AmiA/AmiB activator)
MASNSPSEVRLDLTKGRMALRVFKVALLDSAGSLVCELDGDEFFRTTRHSGLVQIPGGRDGTLVVAGDSGISILMAVKRISPKVGSELIVRLDVCGVPPDTVAQEVAKGLDRNPELVQALAEAQQAVAEQTWEVEKLTGALARAEALVQEHQEQVRRYDAALGEAQRVVAERTQEVENLTGALARAEALVQEHLEQVRRHDAALGEAQLVVAERTQEVENLTGALARAEALVQTCKNDIRLSEADLAETRQVVADLTYEVKNLKNSQEGAQALLLTRTEELRRFDGALGEAQRIAAERARDVEKLNCTLAQISSGLERAEAALKRAEVDAAQARTDLQRMESSLSWRLGRPVRALERLARTFSDRS